MSERQCLCGVNEEVLDKLMKIVGYQQILNATTSVRISLKAISRESWNFVVSEDGNGISDAEAQRLLEKLIEINEELGIQSVALTTTCDYEINVRRLVLKDLKACELEKSVALKSKSFSGTEIEFTLQMQAHPPICELEYYCETHLGEVLSFCSFLSLFPIRQTQISLEINIGSSFQQHFNPFLTPISISNGIKMLLNAENSVVLSSTVVGRTVCTEIQCICSFHSSSIILITWENQLISFPGSNFHQLAQRIFSNEFGVDLHRASNWPNNAFPGPNNAFPVMGTIWNRIIISENKNENDFCFVFLVQTMEKGVSEEEISQAICPLLKKYHIRKGGNNEVNSLQQQQQEEEDQQQQSCESVISDAICEIVSCSPNDDFRCKVLQTIGIASEVGEDITEILKAKLFGLLTKQTHK